jgi:glycosyltransferase involved in cell wall biosynthesis
MRGADVFLLCSRQESLPLSVREGMTAGLPTVATRVGGVPETVEDGESGLLVPKEDPEALAKAMARLAADADRRQAMGRRAAEIVHEKFNYDRWIERTVALYERVRNEVAGRAR